MDKRVRMRGGSVRESEWLDRAENPVLAGQSVAAQLENLRIDLAHAGAQRGAKQGSSDARHLENLAVFQVETAELRFNYGPQTLRHLQLNLLDRPIQLPASCGA